MQVYRVLVKEAWGPWSDFRYETAPSKKEAIKKAMDDMDIPETANEKICITVSQESPIGKKPKSKRKR